MEAVLIRIDLLRDRKQYTSILKTWLQELEITHGRLMTMGDVHLLFIAAREAQISKLLEYYATKEIDTNSQDENKSLLEKVLVHEWHGEQEWLDSALSTPRTKSLLAWREATKAARKDRRKKSAQDRDAAKLLKKQQQAEAEASTKAADALKSEDNSDGEDEANDAESPQQSDQKKLDLQDKEASGKENEEVEEEDSVEVSSAAPSGKSPQQAPTAPKPQQKKRRRNNPSRNQKKKQQKAS